jgi:CRISPR-associated exonuclease Cas4
MEDEDDYVLISSLQHYLYCPRQCALIHQEQEFIDNVFTQRGNQLHELVDIPGARTRNGWRLERALPLMSKQYRIVGRADLVEISPSGVPFPVEYKAGNQAGKLHDRVQLAAQALCLEEMFEVAVEEGAIFWAGTQHRESVPITPELRAQTKDAIRAVIALLRVQTIPAPVFDKKCRNCSLYDLCQPELLTNIVRQVDVIDRLFKDAGE